MLRSFSMTLADTSVAVTVAALLTPAWSFHAVGTLRSRRA
jgi:hypothetical protein